MSTKLRHVAIVAGTLVALGLTGCANSKSSNKSDAQSAKNASMGVVNTHCAMRPGSPVNPDAPTAEWKGQKVGFCCPGCLSAWNKLDDAQKAEHLAKAK